MARQPNPRPEVAAHKTDLDGVAKSRSARTDNDLGGSLADVTT